MYKSIAETIEKYADKIKVGRTGEIDDAWIEFTEEQLGFLLPESYKWFTRQYAYLGWGHDVYVSMITSPEMSIDADVSILYRYNVDERPARKVLLLEQFDGDEMYYFYLRTGIPNNEYPIYKSDVYEMEEELFAKDFASFIQRILPDIR